MICINIYTVQPTPTYADRPNIPFEACVRRWHKEGKLAHIIVKTSDGFSTAVSQDHTLYRKYIKSAEGRAAVRLLRLKMTELCGKTEAVRHNVNAL